MNNMAHCFVYGSQQIEFRLLRSRRRTMQISVLPDLTVEVVAPAAASEDAIIKRLRKRAAWIVRQKKYFTQFLPRTPDRQYVQGETHLYLGRRYRLKVIPDGTGPVRVRPGFIEVHSLTKSAVEKQFSAWLNERAQELLRKRVEECLKRFPNSEAFRPSGIIVRALTHRWGSHTAAGRLVLNRDLVRAHTREIDYVITHELCHRRHHHHGKAFFALLTQVMPDWEARKQSLEQRLA